MPNKATLMPLINPALQKLFAEWLTHLTSERRLSPKTVEAYERDARQFLTFLRGYRGTEPTLENLIDLTPPIYVPFLIVGARISVAAP